jgi:hypothetical protein
LAREHFQKMSWWQTLAREKGGGLTWTAALETFSKAPLPGSESRLLAEKCATPEQLELMADLLRPTPREPESPAARIHLFLSIVDESEHPLAAWIEALEIVYGHLSHSGRDASFGMVLGYIQCCSDAAGSSPALADLSQTVTEMLQAHGFEG